VIDNRALTYYGGRVTLPAIPVPVEKLLAAYRASAAQVIYTHRIRKADQLGIHVDDVCVEATPALIEEIARNGTQALLALFDTEDDGPGHCPGCDGDHL
jgi:hypothetical protein